LIVQADSHSTTSARRIALCCATISGGIALASVAGWVTGMWCQGEPGLEGIVLAPLAAGLMVLLSVALFLWAGWPTSRLARLVVFACAAIAGFTSLWVLGVRLLELDLSFERWRAQMNVIVDGMVVGRISPLTSIASFLTAFALLCLLQSPPQWRSRGRQRLATGSALAILLMVCGVFLGFASGVQTLGSGGQMATTLLTAMGFASLAGGIIALTMHGERWICHIVGESWVGIDAKSRGFRFRLLTAFVVAVVAIGVAGSVYLRQHIAHVRAAAQSELRAIARLKADQIIGWRVERLRDARFFAHASFVRQEVAEVCKKPSSAAARTELLRWLRVLQIVNPNSRLLLLDSELKPCLAVPEGALEIGPVAQQHATEALQAIEPIITDLYQDGPSGKAHLDITFAVLPPSAQPGAEARPIAVVLLQLDPRAFLYPFIQSWPTSSPTAETLLVRREGNTVLYLNDLRHRTNTALNLSFPLNHPELSSAVFLRGDADEMLVEGRDYRGVPVLAVFHRIPDSPWVLEAKTDQEEIFTELRQQTWATIAVLLLLIAVVALAVVLLWRQRLSDSLRRELGLERERKQLAERLALLMHYANDIIVMADADWRIVEANDRALQSYGYSLEELRRMRVFDLRAQETRGKFSAQMAAVQTEGSAIFETVHRRKDGSTFQVEVSSRAVEIEGARYFLAVTRDISDRKRTEGALREVEGRYRSLFQNMLNGFAYCRMVFEQGRPVDFVFIAVNSAFETLTGLKSVVGRNVSEIIPGIREKDPELFEIYGRVVQTGKPEKFETYSESLKKWFAVSAYRPQEGYFVAVFDVITQRKEAELALRESEERYRLLADNADDFVSLNDTEGNRLYLSPSYYRITGWTPEDIKATDWRTRVHPEDLPMIEQTRAANLAGQITMIEYRALCRDGSWLWVETRCKPLAGPDGRVQKTLLWSRDITARKQAEAVIARSRAELKAIYEHAPVLMCLLDAQRCVLYANHAFTEFTGIPETDMVAGRACGVFGCINALDDPRGCGFGHNCSECALRLAIEDTLKTGREHRDVEYQATLERQGVRYSVALLGATSLVQATDQPTLLLCLVDITERTRTEEALRASESALRMAQRLAHVGNWEWDSVTGHTIWSEEMFRIFGRDPALGPVQIEDVPKYFTPESWALVSAAVKKAVADGVSYECDAEIIRSDGVHRWVTTRGEPVRGDGGKTTVLHGSVQDITDHKLAADEIRRFNQTLEQRVRDRTAQLEAANQELESFCYSVSHDLRAPLRAINGFANILAQDHAKSLDDEGQRTLGIVCSEAVRMGRLIDDLLEFSRIGRQALHQVEINMTVVAQRTFDECAAHAPGRDIQLHLHPLPPAQGDPALLPHVWTNLIANAIKYTRPRPVAEIEITGRAEGGERIYCVKDNGVGFDMQYAGKLFGVFQRLHTENEFEGTGVGLALVQRIVLRHGGRVWAEGKVGEGAAFYFSLPVRGLAGGT
jgi:PAS domain S-box-containing protein